MLAVPVLLGCADAGLRRALARMLGVQGLLVRAEADLESARRALASGEARAVVAVCPFPGLDAPATVAALAGRAPLVALVHTLTRELRAALLAAGAAESLDFTQVEELPAAIARATARPR